MIRLHSRLLRRLRRPVGLLDPELPGVFGVQSLPAAEPHRVTASKAADRSSFEKVIHDIESNVPHGGTHRDEAAIDGGPQCKARAAINGFELPADIAVLQKPGSVGSRHG